MASDNDITVRKRRCKDVFDGDLAHYIPGSSEDALTYSKKAEWWAVKWPSGEGDDGAIVWLDSQGLEHRDYSSKKWAVYTDGPVDTANNLFSSKQYALNAEEQAGISLSWADKSQEWAESDTVIEGTETSRSSKYWSGVSKDWADTSLSYSESASNAQQMAWKWAEKTDGPVTGELYSAKYWAGKAEERSGGSKQWSIISHNWANGGLAEGAPQPSSTDTNSSFYWAYQSALSAAAADQYQQLAYSYKEESKRLKLDAVTARTGAETALVKAEAALRLAETAQTASETALTAAETAQGKAEDALEAAETALAAAETALLAAEAAQTKSEQAQDAAETALAAAETAQGKAESAQNAAETALAAAETAQGKAEAAQTAAETAQGKSQEALAAAETALTSAETALDITEVARDRALEWAESDQVITVPGDAGTHYSSKKHAQDALDTFGLTANVYTLTVGVYNDTTVASAAAYGHADDAMRANESAQEAKGDAIDAQTAAETALVAAETARDLAQEWAEKMDGPVEDDQYSARYYSKLVDNKLELLGKVALVDLPNVFQRDNQFNGDTTFLGVNTFSNNNTFTGTNTFNGTMAANGVVVLGSTYGTSAYTAESSELGFFHEVVWRLVARTNFTKEEWKNILQAIKGNLPKDLPLPSSLNVDRINDLFKNCTSLTRLPDAWTFDTAWDIRNTFSGCTNLATLPAGMTFGSVTYGNSAFNGCKALTSASFPAGMTLSSLVYGAPYGMFSGCTGIESVPFTLDHLEEGGSGWAQGMFFNCTKLKELPNVNLASLKKGNCMFYGCQLSADSALRVVRSLPTWDDGQLHVLNLGSDTNFKESTELASLLEGATVPIAKGLYNLLDEDGNRTGWKCGINTMD